MPELELVRLHEDGDHLVLRAPDGQESTLPISDALRAAVRRDRPRTEALPTQGEATLRPRELQARLRAGASAEELAVEAGIPVAHVQRYEWPVMTERDHVIAQVRAHRLDPSGDRTLGEVADARLAARGVTAGEAVWTTRRTGTAPWVVDVRFSAGERERGARWTYDVRTRVVTPLDDEARWLSQPEDPLSPEVFGVPSLAGRSAARPGGSSRRPDAAPDATALLLDDLADRRGQRPAGRSARRPDDAYSDELPLDALEPGSAGDDDGSREASGEPDDVAAPPAPPAAAVVDLGSRRPRLPGRTGVPGVTEHPAGRNTNRPPLPSEPPGPAVPPEERRQPSGANGHSDVVDRTGTPPSPAPSAPTRGSGTRRPARKGRAQVPSWDEIVFGGARPPK
jgi:hypothetical protein